MFLSLKLFLADLRFLLQKGEPAVLGPKAVKGGVLARVIMQVIVSVVILGWGLPIIASAVQDPKTQELAAGLVGAVVGYWLR